jgi:hypothetical protein
MLNFNIGDVTVQSLDLIWMQNFCPLAVLLIWVRADFKIFLRIFLLRMAL